MKKSVSQTLEGDFNERNALTRKLYRYISEAARRVDEGTARSKSIVDLFTPALEVHRQKLRENCEKLIFADPLLYGRKAQELLWRKGYYEAVSTAKRIRTNYKEQEQLVLAHIESGIGHYHHLISKAQMEIGIELYGLVDYPQLDIDIKPPVKPSSDKMEELKDWAKSFIQTCLIYLGDLSRYKTEYEDCWNPSMSYRYYIQATRIDPNIGMPYNQLGTLFTGKNHHLDSVRYYILCLSCNTPFEGAEGNLVRIFDKNSKQLEGITKNPDIVDQQESVKTLICKFLSLVENWYFQKNIPNFNELCTSTLYDLKECLQFRPLAAPDQITSHEDYSKYVQQNETSPEYLNPRLINKFVIILLLCMAKLQKEKSPQLFPLKAFSLAVLSQLLHKLFNDFVDIGFDTDITSKIINSYKEKIKNQRNLKEKDIKLENGFHKPIKSQLSSVIEDEVKESNLDSQSPENQNTSITEIEIKQNKSEKLVNGTAETKPSKKSLKIKTKKVSILQKLRRRRRRINSFDSSDKTESDDDSEEDSDFENDKSTGDSSSSGDDVSIDSYSSSTSSDDDDDNDNNDKTTEDKVNETEGNEKDMNCVESSLNDIHDTNDSNEKIAVPNDVDSVMNDTKPLENQLKTVNEDQQETSKPFDERLLKEFLECDNILMPLRLLLNWLYGEVELIISCGSSGRSMFQALVNVLNIIHGQIFPKLSWNNYTVENQFHPSLKQFHEMFFILKYNGFRRMPLEEDFEVKGMELMEKGLKYIHWNNQQYANLSSMQSNGVRLMKFVDFGTFIVKLNVGIIFNKRLKLYLLKKVSNKKTSPNYKTYGKVSRDPHHNKNPRPASQEKGGGGSLMRSLGRLWLSEQVRALESELSGGRGPQLPAYAVLDADALCHHSHHVRRLVTSRKIIVLVPTIVLQTIDELKKESGAARSAIRWLEGQLRNGSRFIRTQRPSETTPLPCVKYPKKMHRDVQNFIQIIEFCHFFLSNDSGESSVNKKLNGSGDGQDNDKSIKETETGNNTRNSESNSNNLVVLLTGNNQSYVEQKDFSYAGVAQSAGVTMENIHEFCSKWRHCFGKGGRKR